MTATGTAFHRFLGIEWQSEWQAGPHDDDGTFVITMARRDELCGPAGSLEGGIVATLVDVAGATAGARALGSPLVATEHISVSYLAPGRVGPFRATGTVLRRGRRDAVADVRVEDTGNGGRLMAVALVTVRLLEGGPQVSDATT